jgi:hypothetical protein
VHNLVRQQDLSELTAELQRDFQEICNTALLKILMVALGCLAMICGAI